MDENLLLQRKILENTIGIFNEKGLKCTMDDIAKACGISKKTIYTVFVDKEELFLAMVDYIFEGIKKAEEEVANDESLDTIGKLRKLMSVMPNSYQDIDFTLLYPLREKFPNVYFKVADNLENGWESTIALLEKGKEEGLIRKDASIPIIKAMMQSTLENFFRADVLAKNDMCYQEGLSQVVDILIDGITEPKRA